MFTEMNVNYVDHMGDDKDVVNAARVSFNKETKDLREQDTKLLHFLAKNDHWTPYAHCFLKLRVKVPIFVARQWFKHTVGFAYNEDTTHNLMKEAVNHYNELIENGIAPEMARMVLPQATMTEFIVSGSLAAWARFYNLRSDDHAQHEIRWCAEQVSTITAGKFPNGWAALCNKCQPQEWNFGEEKH